MQNAAAFEEAALRLKEEQAAFEEELRLKEEQTASVSNIFKKLSVSRIIIGQEILVACPIGTLEGFGSL
jgi:hypothetical protein